MADVTPSADYDAGGWQAETLADLRADAARIVANMHSCTCPDSPHMNALHDLAHDVVRILPPTSDQGADDE